MRDRSRALAIGRIVREPSYPAILVAVNELRRVFVAAGEIRDASQTGSKEGSFGGTPFECLCEDEVRARETGSGDNAVLIVNEN